QPVNEQQLEEARQKIIEIYQGRGFTDVSVQFRIDPIDEKRGTSRVVYTVNEGVRGAVSRINFEGNTHFSAKLLRKQMKTRGRTPISFLAKSGRFDEPPLQQDLVTLREFYQDPGYIDAPTKGVRKERMGKRPMILTIVIAEGPPAGPALIDVHYSIEEGVRSFVNRVNIEANTRTKDKVIRREVLVAPGDVFNTVRVDITKKRLENLGYFAKVETYPEETDIP